MASRPPLLSQAKGRGNPGVQPSIGVRKTEYGNETGGVQWKNEKPANYQAKKNETYEEGVVSRALDKLETGIAEYTTAAIAAVGYKDASTVSEWSRVAANCDSGCVFVLDRIAAAGGVQVVVDLLLTWLPVREDDVSSSQCFRPQQSMMGSAAKSAAAHKECTFDAFIHKIPSYRNTNSALTELLETVVESVVTELLGVVLQYFASGVGGDLSHVVISRLLDFAVAGLVKVGSVALVSEVAVPLRRRVADRWALVIGLLTPKAFLTVASLLHRVSAAVASASPPGAEQSAAVFRAMRCVQLDSNDTSHIDAVHSVLELQEGCFAAYSSSSSRKQHSAFSSYKGEKLTSDQILFRDSQLLAIDSWVQQIDFTIVHGSRSSPPSNEKYFAVFDLLDNIFKLITEGWSTRKSQDKNLGPQYNLLASTIMARSLKSFYGANIEIFLRKRLLKMVHHDEGQRNNALACILRLLRGPKWCEDNRETIRSSFQLPLQRTDSIFSGCETSHGTQYGCIMGAFEGCNDSLWRAEALMWIISYLFGGLPEPRGAKKKYGRAPKPAEYKRCPVDLDNADCFVAIVVQLAANDLNDGSTLLRHLLNLAQHKVRELTLVGLRAVRTILDPASNFMEYAAKTRVNAARMVDPDTAAIDLQVAAQTGIQHILGIIDDAVGVRVIGLRSQMLKFDSLIDNPSADGIFATARFHAVLKSAQEVKHRLPLTLLLDSMRCLPYLSWRSGLGAFIKAQLLVHNCPQIAEMMSFSLQRTMINHPNLRPAVVEAALMLLSETALQCKALQCSVLGQIKGLLAVWKHLLKDAVHSQDRVTIVNPDTVLSEENEYSTWIARVEASIIVCMAHPDREVRTAALPILNVVQECREARQELCKVIRRDKGTDQSQPPSEAQLLESQCPTVAEILAVRGPSIVQKGLYRFMLSGVDGVKFDVTMNERRAAPTIEKVAAGYGDMWIHVLSEAAYSIASHGHPRVWDDVRTLLYARLDQPGFGVGLDGENVQGQEIFKSYLTLLFSFIGAGHHARARTIAESQLEASGKAAANVALVSGSPAAEAAASGRLELLATKLWEQYLGKPPAVQGNESTSWARSALQAACSSVPTRGLEVAVRSLSAWFDELMPKRKRLAIADMWWLLRVFSQSRHFAAALACSATLRKHFMSLSVSPLVVQVPFASLARDDAVQTPSRLDGVLIVLNVASALNAAIDGAAVDDDDSLVDAVNTAESGVVWGPPERRTLYKWLREIQRMFEPHRVFQEHRAAARSEARGSRLSAAQRQQHSQSQTNAYPSSAASEEKLRKMARIARCVRLAEAALLRQGPLLDQEDVKRVAAERDRPNRSAMKGKIDPSVPAAALTTMDGSPLEWFLHAEADGQRVLRFLLAYHPAELRPLSFTKVYQEDRPYGLYFFHALCDQVLPDPTPPTPPNTGVTADVGAYFDRLAKWGGEQDLANLSIAARVGRRRSTMPAMVTLVEGDGIQALAAGSLPLHKRVVSMCEAAAAGLEPTSIDPDTAACLVALGLRALLDTDQVVRIRAFALVRRVLGDVLLAPSKKARRIPRDMQDNDTEEYDDNDSLDDEEDDSTPTDSQLDNFDEGGLTGAHSSAKRFAPVAHSFDLFMAGHEAFFEADTSATVREHALEIVERVAHECAIHGHLDRMIAQLLDPNTWSRPEWGGCSWTADIVAPFCRYITLTVPSNALNTANSLYRSDGGGGVVPVPTAHDLASGQGMTPRAGTALSICAESFLSKLFDTTLRFPPENLPHALLMWAALSRSGSNAVGDLSNQQGEEKSSTATVHSNLPAILHFLLGKAGNASGFGIRACREIALSMYSVDPLGTATAVCYPLTFVGQNPGVCVLKRGESCEKPAMPPARPQSQRNIRPDTRPPGVAIESAESAVSLLVEMARVNISALVPHLPIILHFSLVHFPSTFEATKQQTREELSNSHLLPKLLYNILTTMREHLRSSSTSPTNFDERLSALPPSVPDCANVLSAQLLAADFKLRWGTSSDDASPSTGTSTPASPGVQQGFVSAPPEAGVDAQSFVKEIVKVLSVLMPQGELQSALGEEALRWAFHVPSGAQLTVAVKAHQVFRSILSPVNSSVVEGLIRGLATTMCDLEMIVDREREAGNKPSAGRTDRKVTAHGSNNLAINVVSIGHFQATTIANELLTSLEASVDCFRTKSSTVQTAIVLELSNSESGELLIAPFWLAVELLRCSARHPVVYRRAISLLQTLLSSSTISDALQTGDGDALPALAASWSPNHCGLMPCLAHSLYGDGLTAAAGRSLIAELAGAKHSAAVDYAPNRMLRLITAVLPWLYSGHSQHPPSADGAKMAAALAQALKSRPFDRVCDDSDVAARRQAGIDTAVASLAAYETGLKTFLPDVCSGIATAFFNSKRNVRQCASELFPVIRTGGYRWQQAALTVAREFLVLSNTTEPIVAAFRPLVSFAAALTNKHEGLRAAYATIPPSELESLRDVASELLDAVLLAHIRSKSGSLSDMLSTDAAFELLGKVAGAGLKNTATSSSVNSIATVVDMRTDGLVGALEKLAHFAGGMPVDPEVIKGLDVQVVVDHCSDVEDIELIGEGVSIDDTRSIEQKPSDLSSAVESIISPVSATPASQSGTREVYEVAYDFEAVDEEQISVNEGERVFVIEKADDGWWTVAVCGDPNKSGLVPGNYMAPILAPPAPPASSVASPAQAPPAPLAQEPSQSEISADDTPEEHEDNTDVMDSASDAAVAKAPAMSNEINEETNSGATGEGIEKYSRMVKMGISKGAVLNAMARDGFSPPSGFFEGDEDLQSSAASLNGTVSDFIEAADEDTDADATVEIDHLEESVKSVACDDADDDTGSSPVQDDVVKDDAVNDNAAQDNAVQDDSDDDSDDDDL